MLNGHRSSSVNFDAILLRKDILAKSRVSQSMHRVWLYKSYVRQKKKGEAYCSLRLLKEVCSNVGLDYKRYLI